MKMNVLHKYLLFILTLLYIQAFAQEKEESKGKKVENTFNIIVKAKQKESLFRKNKVKYLIKLVNNYNEQQDGYVIVEVRTDRGKTILGTRYDVSIPPKTTYYLKPKFSLKDPGFYDLWVTAELTSYDDTISRPKLNFASFALRICMGRGPRQRDAPASDRARHQIGLELRRQTGGPLLVGGVRHG